MTRSRMILRRCGGALLAVSLSAVAACSGSMEADEFGPDSVDMVAEEIIDGDASTNNKVVQVLRSKADGGTSLCTGTLLRSNIVLTADHCVGTQSGGQWLRHRIRTRSGTTVEVTNQNQVREHGDADIALMKLDGHVAINGNTDYTTLVHEGTVSGLVGRDLTCVGYGIKTCGGSDSGTQLKATLRVNTASATTLNYLANADGQILSSGDSGGPCLLNGKVVGTTRTVTSSCGSANQVPMTTYAAWINDTIADLVN